MENLEQESGRCSPPPPLVLGSCANSSLHRSANSLLPSLASRALSARVPVGMMPILDTGLFSGCSGPALLISAECLIADVKMCPRLLSRVVPHVHGDSDTSGFCWKAVHDHLWVGAETGSTRGFLMFQGVRAGSQEGAYGY